MEINTNNKYIIKRIVTIGFIFFTVINLFANTSGSQADIGEQLQSSAAVLIDGDTGQVLFEKNMNRKMYPASITKILTAIVALEKGNMDDTLTMSYDAVFSIGLNSSSISLSEGESLTFEQAMYALAIASANDAANGIAEYISGSMEEFAVQMNERAKKAGALNSNFTNAHGLPDENHYTNAYDMARIMMTAIKNPEFIKIFGSTSYEIPPTNKLSETRSLNRKASLLSGEYWYSSTIAEKTGWTPEAGYTFAAAAKRDGRTLIAVVMNSPDETARWMDTTLLFDYGFDEFTSMNLAVKELIKKDYVIESADEVRINAELIPSNDFNCLVLKEIDKADIEIKYMLSAEGVDGKLHGKAVFELAPGAANLMYSNLGELTMQVYFNAGESDIPVNAALPDENQTEQKGSVFSVILKIIGGIAAVVLLFFLRLFIIARNRKRRRVSYMNVAGRNRYR